MNEFSWQIEHQCPRCGAPVLLAEADRLFVCPFCRTRLYLATGDYARYRIPPPGPLPGETLYAPYWRLKGLSFSLSDTEDISPRFVDTSMRAASLANLPQTLGFKPQVFKLNFRSPADSGNFISPTRSPAEIMAGSDTGDMPGGGSAPLFIGETVSLIYSPLYRKNDILYDAFLKKPLPGGTGGELTALPATTGKERWEIRFIPLVCPRCGWDLEGAREAVVLLCKNCDSAWTCREHDLAAVTFAVMTGKEPSACYLPFWRMKPRSTDLALESYADLIRAVNLPKVPTPASEASPLYFWSPAFKINPALFLRWSRQMTVSPVKGEMAEEFPDADLYPATLPPGEAAQSMKITLAGICSEKRRRFSLFEKAAITADEIMLVYQPFTSYGSDLVHATTRMAIDKKALAYAAYL